MGLDLVYRHNPDKEEDNTPRVHNQGLKQDASASDSCICTGDASQESVPFPWI